MEFDGFNWDSGNREKCRKHRLSIVEIESVFDGPVVVLPDKENPQGEQRFRAIGAARNGRKVFVVFTLRNHADGVLIRPISARYMHKKEVESYEKSYPNV
jgi:uncharacterized DUF497 family protein